MSSALSVLTAWSDAVMNKLDRRRRLPLFTLVSADECSCQDMFEYITGTRPSPSFFTSGEYSASDNNSLPSHIGSDGYCMVGTLHGTSFGGCAALTIPTSTLPPVSVDIPMPLHPPLCFSSDAIVATVAAATMVRGAVGVIFPSVESVGRHQLLLELAAAARLCRLAAPGMRATGELLPQSSLIIIIYSDSDSSMNSTSHYQQQQELTDWIFRTESIYKEGSLCGVSGTHINDNNRSSIYYTETKFNNSNVMMKDSDAVERNELRVCISSMYQSCNVVIVLRRQPPTKVKTSLKGELTSNTPSKPIISPEFLTELRNTIRKILLRCQVETGEISGEPLRDPSATNTIGHVTQASVSEFSCVMSPEKAAERVGRLLMSVCSDIHVPRDLVYVNKEDGKFMNSVDAGDVKLLENNGSLYSNNSHLSISEEVKINSDVIEMEVGEERLWVQKKLDAIVKSNFIGYCTTRQANLTEELVMSAYESTKSQCQKLLLLLEMRGNTNNTHIDNFVNDNQGAGEKECKVDDQRRKIDGPTIPLDPSSSPLYPHRIMDDAKKRFILVARANAQVRKPLCSTAVRSDLSISNRSAGSILLSRRAGEMARNTKRGAIVMRDTTSRLVTQYRIWVESNIPHRYQFWLSGYGALIVSGMFFFVILSYWSR